MKVLFSPSESKRSGGGSAPFSEQSLLFPKQYAQRAFVIDAYNAYAASVSDAQLAKLLGLKEIKNAQVYRENLFHKPTMKAVRRYSGVAFDYLDYDSLSEQSQTYIDRDTIIFSNLFGPIRAGDFIPEYKLKQGEKIGSLAPEVFYKKVLTPLLDELLGQAPYLDLRAGFYSRFYKASTPHTTLKFVKNGKVVSHWAKAYRGIVLRALAQEGIVSMEAFMALPIEGLALREVIRRGVQTEIVFEIEAG